MALTGITLVENQEFRSQFDTSPEEDQTVFTIGAIDTMVRSHIQDNSQAWQSSESGTLIINRSATRNYEVCRFGLKDIVRNFKDPKGNDIKISFVDRVIGGKIYKIVEDKILNTIPAMVINEMAEKILEINTASEDLRKK